MRNTYLSCSTCVATICGTILIIAVGCGESGPEQSARQVRELTPVIEQFHQAAAAVDTEVLFGLTTGSAAEDVGKIAAEPETADRFKRFGAAHLEIESAERMDDGYEVEVELTPAHQPAQIHKLMLKIIDGNPHIARFSAPPPVAIHEITVQVLVEDALAEALEDAMTLVGEELRSAGIATADTNIVDTARESTISGAVGFRLGIISCASGEDADRAIRLVAQKEEHPSLVLKRSTTETARNAITVEFSPDYRNSFVDSLFAHMRTAIEQLLEKMGAVVTTFPQSTAAGDHTLTFRTVLPRELDIHGRLAWLTSTMRLGLYPVRGDSAVNSVFYPTEAELLVPTGGTVPPGTFTASMRGAGDEPARWYLLERAAVVTGRDLKKATVSLNERNQKPELALSFNYAGAARLRRFSENALGVTMAIVLDRRVLLAARIEGALAGDVVVSGNFTPKELEDIAKLLNLGALPAPMRVVSQKQIDELR